VARKIARSFSVRRPRLADFRGRLLRDYIEALDGWLDKLQGFQAEPGARRDRYIAVTSGTITANAGTSGPLGFGNVIHKLRKDDRTLVDAGGGELIRVENLILEAIPTGRLVVVELIAGVDTITAVVCP
jgi:hypothetical protein